MGSSRDSLFEASPGYRVYPFLAYATSPVFVGGNQKTGATQLLARIKVLVDGRPEELPFIPGNSLRGRLRRIIFRDWLRLLGYRIDVDKKGGLMLYHALFSGGVLEAAKSASKTGVVSLEVKRRVLRLIPPARLFGMALGNQMIESRLTTGMLVPIAREFMAFLPEELHDMARENSVYDYLTTMFQTRRDELRAEREEDEQAVQMLVEYEVFAPGTPFYGELALNDPAPIDHHTLARLVDLWSVNPQVGGKARLGFGRLRVRWLADPRQDGDSAEYVSYVEEVAEDARKLLDELQSLL